MKTYQYVIIAIVVVIVIALLLFKEQLKALVAPKKQTQTKTTTASDIPAELDYNKILFKGIDAKPEVKKLQGWLGITADGSFGPITEAALQNRKGVDRISLKQFSELADATHGASGDYSDTGTLSYASGGGLFQSGINGAISWLTT